MHLPHPALKFVVMEGEGELQRCNVQDLRFDGGIYFSNCHCHWLDLLINEQELAEMRSRD